MNAKRPICSVYQRIRRALISVGRFIVVIGASMAVISVIWGVFLLWGALENTNKTVDFIHQIQTSPNAQTSRDSAIWEIKELRAICAAQPGCTQVPLPPDVAKAIQAD